MTDPERVVFAPGTIVVDPFPPSSRYHGLGVVVREMPDGGQMTYVRRRFVPQPERFELLQEHRVTQGDRLDTLTARYLGDPEQFWRVADANRAMQPDALTAEVGRRLRITLPEGIPANPNA
jgi:hypothetical protein